MIAIGLWLALGSLGALLEALVILSGRDARVSPDFFRLLPPPVVALCFLFATVLGPIQIALVLSPKRPRPPRGKPRRP